MPVAPALSCVLLPVALRRGLTHRPPLRLARTSPVPTLLGHQPIARVTATQSSPGLANSGLTAGLSRAATGKAVALPTANLPSTNRTSVHEPECVRAAAHALPPARREALRAGIMWRREVATLPRPGPALPQPRTTLR